MPLGATVREPTDSSVIDSISDEGKEVPERLRAERGSIWAVLGNTFVGHEVDGIATRLQNGRNRLDELGLGDGTMSQDQYLAVLVVSDRLGMVMADFELLRFEV